MAVVAMLFLIDTFISYKQWQEQITFYQLVKINLFICDMYMCGIKNKYCMPNIQNGTVCCLDSINDRVRTDVPTTNLS